jgi:hypothetical protein
VKGRRAAHARCQHQDSWVVAGWTLFWLFFTGAMIWIAVGIAAVSQ